MRRSARVARESSAAAEIELRADGWASVGRIAPTPFAAVRRHARGLHADVSEEPGRRPGGPAALARARATFAPGQHGCSRRIWRSEVQGRVRGPLARGRRAVRSRPAPTVAL